MLHVYTEVTEFKKEPYLRVWMKDTVQGSTIMTWMIGPFQSLLLTQLYAESKTVYETPLAYYFARLRKSRTEMDLISDWVDDNFAQRYLDQIRVGVSAKDRVRIEHL